MIAPVRAIEPARDASELPRSGWWAYPDNPTTWLVGGCVPYNPQFAPGVREVRPTEAVREVMRQHGWSWQIR